jgi:signal transduction histidine kinase
MVEISVMDTGIGMNKKVIDNLFRLDSNVNRNGTEDELSTGLGLIICKDFIGINGGKLRGKSKEGIGSTFIFSLPMNPINS